VLPRVKKNKPVLQWTNHPTNYGLIVDNKELGENSVSSEAPNTSAGGNNSGLSANFLFLRNDLKL